MTSVIKKFAEEFQTFNYKNLPPKVKRKCRENIIAIITGKNTTSGSNWLTLELSNGNCLWLEVFDTTLRYCENSTKRSNLEKAIVLEKLPRRAELLLAITHWPIFELYKKYLEYRSGLRE